MTKTRASWNEGDLGQSGKAPLLSFPRAERSVARRESIPGNPEWRTTLMIYDIRGRRIQTLVDKDLEPGRHSVTWDGRDDKAVPVPSGIYLYSLRNGEEVKTRKMTIIE